MADADGKPARPCTGQFCARPRFHRIRSLIWTGHIRGSTIVRSAWSFVPYWLEWGRRVPEHQPGPEAGYRGLRRGDRKSAQLPSMVATAYGAGCVVAMGDVKAAQRRFDGGGSSRQL
nr:hypothetical protein CFP56_76777 [Quercus suber]